jgi:hypothetical protein
MTAVERFPKSEQLAKCIASGKNPAFHTLAPS